MDKCVKIIIKAWLLTFGPFFFMVGGGHGLSDNCCVRLHTEVGGVVPSEQEAWPLRARDTYFKPQPGLLTTGSLYVLFWDRIVLYAGPRPAGPGRPRHFAISGLP